MRPALDPATPAGDRRHVARVWLPGTVRSGAVRSAGRRGGGAGGGRDRGRAGSQGGLACWIPSISCTGVTPSPRPAP